MKTFSLRVYCFSTVARLFMHGFLLLLITSPLCAQSWYGTNVPTTVSDWNTSITFSYTGWGAQNGLLFNAHRSPSLVDGPLSQAGNTKHTFEGGPWGNGAGAIMFLGNGGRMDFLISPVSPGAGSNVDWGIPKMTIERSGNVGIGTLSPDFKLTVNGKIKAEEIQVVVDVPADYVFTPDYKLLPLTEVSKHIQEKGHLPNVPSAEQLKTVGWNVGEMNNKLLEKIEELTLYIVDQQRQLDSLKLEIKRIQIHQKVRD